MAVMFPFSEEALARRAAIETQRAQAKAKSERFLDRAKRGYLKRGRMSRRQRQLQAQTTELWLLELLSQSPAPLLARVALDLAKAHHIPLTGLRRAKRRLGVRSV